MKTAIRLLIAFTAVASLASAAYTPYFTDATPSFLSANWTNNSSTYISKVAVPDGTSSYEIKATLQSTARVELLLRASPDANPFASGGPVGTFYQGEFVPGQYFELIKCVNGTCTYFGTTNLSTLSAGSTIRMTINDNGVIAVYANDSYVFDAVDQSIASGSPGIQCGTTCTVNNIQLGPADRIAPISVPTLSDSVYSTHVDLQWTGSAQDDTNGTGIAFMALYRNLAWVASVTNGSGTWSDTTVQSGTAYSYSLVAFDFHWNTLFSTTVNVVIPNSPAGSPNPPDGHETGVRTTGTYWGAGNEQIDVLSGNVNFTVPLLKAVGRNVSAAFNLTYNSQNWRSDSGGLWDLGADNGYGYGWKLLAGAVTPVYSGGSLSYYAYYDSTGASYRLNVNNSGVWSSLESVYVWLDTNASPYYKLHFRDGTFWILGCTSASGEHDAGTLYPTIMESADGNQIVISYLQGVNGSTTNTSSRISLIQDARSSAAYQFSYSSPGAPSNLTGITNGVGTAESYSFSYLTSTTMQAPFSPYTSDGAPYLLSTVTVSGEDQQYSFTYGSNNSGEITYAYLPYGGYLRWDYNNVTYTNGATYRQVQTRYLSKDGVSATSYPFSHETSTLNLHSFTVIDDPGGVGEKYWAFSLSGANTSMVTQYQGRQLPGPVALTQNDFTWAQDTNGNLFIQSALTTQDPGQSYQAQKKTVQNVDVYGNVTQVFQYDFGNLTTPARVYSYTYLNNSNYTPLYIFNRLTQATLSDQTLRTLTLATNSYDASFTAAPSGVTMWDSAYASINYRGDVTSSTTPAGSYTYNYDRTGTMTATTQNGVSTTITPSSSSGYAVPSQITTGSLSESMTWSSFLGLTGTTGPNTDTASTVYDSYARPSYSISVYGARTDYSYSSGPYSSSSQAWSQSTINGRFAKTTLDGLGRTLTVQSGTGSTVVSQVDTVYGSCGCSPGGKMLQTSLPHAPGGTPVWTTYSYDGIGRTTSVLSPDGASTTRYFYAGNTVTVTDPAGKWKKYAMDAFGDVTQVTEPDPTTSVTGITVIAAKSGMTTSVVTPFPATVSGGGGGGGGSWYNPSWGYRKSITVGHTMVSGGSTLTNFPVLVSVTDANLKTVANGGYVGKSDGTDILFTASDQVTKLNHEIESYNASTGNVIAWVQVPSLSNSADTVLYAYYGNASASDQQNATAVWDSNYKGVYHLPNGTTLTANDSTANGNNGTNSGATAATGEVGGGASFNGSSAYVNAGAGTSLQNSTLTYEVWVKPASLSGYHTILNQGCGAPTLRLQSSGAVFAGKSNYFDLSNSTSTISTSTWSDIAFTWNASTGAYAYYINGTQVGSGTQTASFIWGSLYLSSAQSCSSEYFNGLMDELRLSNTIRSSGWIATGYNNQSAPGTYLSLGSQQAYSTGGSWYNSSWGYRESVTVSHTMVSGGSSLTNFPVLVSVTDTNLKTVANGGYVGKSDGTDILFTASDQVTKLNHEIESYNASTGNVIAWVQIPSLSNSADTVLYAYYGNASASDQQNKTAVWDSNYGGVWHLPNGTTLTASDSTANGYNGTLTNTPTATTGEIAGGANFAGSSSQYVSVAGGGGLNNASAGTLEMWVRWTSSSEGAGYVDYGAVSGRQSNGYFSDDILALSGANPNTANITWTMNGSAWNNLASSVSPGLNTWVDVAITWGSSGMTMYVNGSQTATTSTAGSAHNNSAVPFTIGAWNGDGASYSTANIDEVRTSNTVRSAGWIATGYNNQSAPGTYLSLGSQQAYSSGGSQVTTPTFSQNGATLTISDATSGATIYYTTDGSTPTTSSSVYSGPISLSTSTYGTTYTYDWLSHLIKVSMPRPSGTQTRTFVYSATDLMSTTNPENGTVSYTYDTNHRLSTKTDAKGQQIVYTYDSYGRTSEVQRYYKSGSSLVEDTSQQVLYYYDSNPFDSSYSQYASGRLAAIKYLGGNCSSLGPPRTGCDTIEEMYNYNVAGAALGKRVRLIRGSNHWDLNGYWTYDTEGRMTGVTYPSWGSGPQPGSNYTYAYDTMGRLNTMTDALNSTSMISGVTYGVANEVQAISGSFFNESRSYNSLFQLAQITVSGALNIQYAYSGTMNNGKITSQTDVISGEQVVYTYDALNRLATAQTVTASGVTQWGQGYNYDGFGNLTDQIVTKGSAPGMSVTYNAATNRQSGDTADANGNLGSGYVYDIANRLLQASSTTMQYAYDSSNKRVWRGDGSSVDEIAFWGVSGQKLGTYTAGVNLTTTNVYFGSRLIAKGTVVGSGYDYVTLASVATDRLGSIGKFYPYGQEKPSATANDTEKFTGYFRDAATTLDYAVNRYEQPGVGRFMTADPAASSAKLGNPGSWNRYDYVGDDPINRTDPSGLCLQGQTKAECIATGVGGSLQIVGGAASVVGGAVLIGGTGVGVFAGVALVGSGLSGIATGFNNIVQSIKPSPGFASNMGVVSGLYNPISAVSALSSGKFNALSPPQKAFAGAAGSAFSKGISYAGSAYTPSTFASGGSWFGILGNMIIASIPDLDPTLEVVNPPPPLGVFPPPPTMASITENITYTYTDDSSTFSGDLSADEWLEIYGDPSNWGDNNGGDGPSINSGGIW